MRIRSWQAVGFLVAVSVAVVLAGIPSSTWVSLATLSLASGVTALSLMGTAAFLSARWRFIESLFGGLDRVYLTHKWLGVWALVFASVHLLFKAGTEGWTTAAIMTFPGFWTRFVRQLSFVSLMFIVLLALNRKIPYATWRWWHKLSGPLFVVVILHWLSFKTPLVLASPAGAWLVTVSALGVAGAFYKLVLYPFVSSHGEYRIDAVTRGKEAVQLDLSPVGRPVPFKAGQFAFLSLHEDGLREPHPFTIASGGGADGKVRFLIRALGDHTRRLVAEASVGLRADLHLPYGRFRRPDASTNELWIAGGVGISPFVAWLADGAGRSLEHVTLFYFFTPGREFPAPDELARLAAERGARFVACPEGPSSPAFLAQFAALVLKSGAASVDVRFCGPKGLGSAVRGLMAKHGVPASKMEHEFFEFR